MDPPRRQPCGQRVGDRGWPAGHQNGVQRPLIRCHRLGGYKAGIQPGRSRAYKAHGPASADSLAPKGSPVRWGLAFIEANAHVRRLYEADGGGRLRSQPSGPRKEESRTTAATAAGPGHDGGVGRRPVTTASEPNADAVEHVACAMIAAGRVVPGLTVEPDGRSRSWWWPLPAASHRSLIASLVVEPSAAGQRRAADRLAEAVDAMVRDRLAGEKLVLAPRRGGRPAVADAWARSLVSADPWMPASLDPAKVRALAQAVTTWIRSGAVIAGRVRLCLRVREPARGDGWSVELLAQDRDEPSLVLPLADVWAGRSPFGPSAVEEVLTSLGRMARLAPELAAALDEAAPDSLALDGASVGPAAARARRPPRRRRHRRPPPVVVVPPPPPRRAGQGDEAVVVGAGCIGSGLGIDAIVEFTLGGRARRAAADQGRPRRPGPAPSRPSGRWCGCGASGWRSTPTASSALLESIGNDRRRRRPASCSAPALGLDELGVSTRRRRRRRRRARPSPGSRSLLDDALHATVEPVPTPAGFDGDAPALPGAGRRAGWRSSAGSGSARAWPTTWAWARPRS